MLTRLRSRLAHVRLRRRTQGDVDAFLDAARRSFVCVQQAWDRADLAALSQLATAQLVEELRDQLAERGPAPNHTEVLSLEARLLALEQLSEAQVASIEFSGLIREQRGERPRPFRELWMLARPQGPECAWRVARVQALG